MQIPQPQLDYQWPELRRICLRISSIIRSIKLDQYSIEILAVRPYQVHPGWSIGLHAHSFYETHIFFQGSGKYRIGEEQAFHPGSVIMHGPHTLHSWQADEYSRRLVLWFRVSPEIPIPQTTVWPIHESFLHDIALLLNDGHTATAGWGERARLRVQLLLATLLNIPDTIEESVIDTDRTESMIEEVDRFLRDNLAAPVTISDIAAHVGMSISSLAHQFSSLTGESIMQRLIKLRMDHAAELLIETTDAISSIGNQVGITDTSYFCRRFRRHFGKTPTDFRDSGI
ncbi:MAG TPA: AraC family transcriptional regulator [Armatimonadota bacterium]|nr:AraC family transcriptional regulator [Armatimonadota bacterium]